MPLKDTDYYFNNLKKFKSLKKDMLKSGTVPPVELNNLYLLSFMGLLRLGYKYERKDEAFIDDFNLNEPDENNEEDKSKKKPKLPIPKLRNAKEELTGMLADDPTRSKKQSGEIIVIKKELDIYECPEIDLKNYFGELYDQLMNKVDAGSKSDLEGGVFISMPDIFANDDDTVKTKKKRGGKKIEEEETVNENSIQVDIIESFKQYPDDPLNRKAYDSFLFNQHYIVVPMKNNLDRKYIATIYPLMMDTSDCIASDILVVMIDDQGRMRSNCSSCLPDEPKQIDLDYTENKFVVRGKFKDGDFITEVVLVEDTEYEDEFRPQKKEQIKRVRPTTKTSSFYLRSKCSDGSVIDVFPTRLKQNDNETGIAPSVLIHETGKPRTVLTPTGKNCYELMADGDKKDVIPFWEGNDLVIEIKKSDD